MTANITWSIESVVWDTATGGITTAHWRVIAIDGEFSADAYGSVGFSPDPSSKKFIALENVTPEKVIAWVKSQEELSGIEESLLSQIEKKKNPVQQSGLPWTMNEGE